MLNTLDQGPPCIACGSPMKLAAVEPSSTGHDLRTFACPKCSRVQRHIIESAAPESWLGQKRGNAVTYEIHNGRMIAKPAGNKGP